MRFAVLAALQCCLPLIALATGPDDEIKGRWQITAMELRGMKLPAEAIGPLKVAVLELGDGKLTIRAGDKVLHEGEYKVNAKASPKTIEGNLTPQAGRGDKQPEASVGIYEVEGDTLRICFGVPGGKTPTKFTTEGPGGGATLLVYQRVK